MKRVWHPMDSWEEIEAGMWSDVDDPAAYLLKAIAFTGDHEKYGSYMQRVIKEWPISCENALTDKSLNRRAWVGHAACAMAIGCPEDITRKAWGYLTDEQREMANRQADRAIAMWEYDYGKSGEVYPGLEGTLL